MSSEAKVSYDLKRFAGIKRDYTPEQVERLRGSIKIEHSMCKHQSTKLWKLLNSESYINTLGSLSGNHAVQHAKAGLKAPNPFPPNSLSTSVSVFFDNAE